MAGFGSLVQKKKTIPTVDVYGVATAPRCLFGAPYICVGVP